MNDKKILMLSMSCNIPHYQGLLGGVKDTWAKPLIQNKYENITWFGYTSCDKRHPEPMIDFEEHMIYVDVPDTLEYTYLKTQKMYNMIKDLVDFDYVVRTNCSVFVNVDNMLKRLNVIDNNSIIGRIVKIDISDVDYYWLIYGFFFAMNRKNFEIGISVEQEKILKQYDNNVLKKYNLVENTDDNLISINLSNILGNNFPSEYIENKDRDIITTYKPIHLNRTGYEEERYQWFSNKFQFENSFNPDIIKDRVMVRLRPYVDTHIDRIEKGHEIEHMYELNSVIDN